MILWYVFIGLGLLIVLALVGFVLSCIFTATIERWLVMVENYKSAQAQRKSYEDARQWQVLFPDEHGLSGILLDTKNGTVLDLDTRSTFQIGTDKETPTRESAILLQKRIAALTGTSLTRTVEQIVQPPTTPQLETFQLEAIDAPVLEQESAETIEI